ncbi:MAG: hypothetical protein JWP89_858 [Schlesneria sp.]|nr:hypothetical protein [Schlesneria sp.]
MAEFRLGDIDVRNYRPSRVPPDNIQKPPDTPTTHPRRCGSCATTVELTDDELELTFVYPTPLVCPKCNRNFSGMDDKNIEKPPETPPSHTPTTHPRRCGSCATMVELTDDELKLTFVYPTPLVCPKCNRNFSGIDASKTGRKRATRRPPSAGEILIGTCVILCFVPIFSQSNSSFREATSPPSGMTPSPVTVNQSEYDYSYRKFRDAGLNANDAKTAADAVKKSVESKHR